MFEFVDNIMSLLYGSMGLLGLFVLTWVISVVIKNLGVVDVIWGFGFFVQALLFYFTSDHTKSFTYHRPLFFAFVSLHTLRLTIYILIRAWGKPEDKRYTDIFRNKYGDNTWWVSLFNVFLFQCLINLIVGFPIFAFSASTIMDINDVAFWIGISIMFIGTIYETVADLQLYYFKANPDNKGKVLNSGLWYFCRSPNYFAEFVFWIGIYIVNVSAKIYFTAFSPVIMIIFLLWVSGVTVKDKYMKRDYSDEYKHYIKSTSSFIPWCKYNVEKLDP
jgi:steroid 5-alpha reductase family enzyme